MVTTQTSSVISSSTKLFAVRMLQATSNNGLPRVSMFHMNKLRFYRLEYCIMFFLTTSCTNLVNWKYHSRKRKMRLVIPRWGLWDKISYSQSCTRYGNREPRKHQEFAAAPKTLSESVRKAWSVLEPLYKGRAQWRAPPSCKRHISVSVMSWLASHQSSSRYLALFALERYKSRSLLLCCSTGTLQPSRQMPLNLNKSLGCVQER